MVVVINSIEKIEIEMDTLDRTEEGIRKIKLTTTYKGLVTAVFTTTSTTSLCLTSSPYFSFAIL